MSIFILSKCFLLIPYVFLTLAVLSKSAGIDSYILPFIATKLKNIRGLSGRTRPILKWVPWPVTWSSFCLTGFSALLLGLFTPVISMFYFLESYFLIQWWKTEWDFLVSFNRKLGVFYRTFGEDTSSKWLSS